MDRPTYNVAVEDPMYIGPPSLSLGGLQHRVEEQLGVVLVLMVLRKDFVCLQVHLVGVIAREHLIAARVVAAMRLLEGIHRTDRTVQFHVILRRSLGRVDCPLWV